MAKAKLPIITQQEVIAKRASLALADNYVYTEVRVLLYCSLLMPLDE